ncbi:MAG: HAD-IA family hydrolase [Alphaproteobacteria bacterium]|nr:HAD-IA family hydrolase [Alphaproteobacteria bacterium]
MLPRITDIKLIIFDCDGVLVDSEPAAMAVLLETLADKGLEIDETEAYDRFLGRSLASARLTLTREYGLELDEGAIARMREKLFALYDKQLLACAGIFDALDELPETIQTCVASSSQPERIRHSLHVTGLLEKFDGRIFSATQVKNGKPAPDLFLLAAKTMGVAPAQCLVIEDSPAGINAAKAAKMRVFAYLGGSHIEPSGFLGAIKAARPDAMFAQMADLPGKIGNQKPAIPRHETGRLLMAVDVGTANVRAGVFSLAGRLLGRAQHTIEVKRIGADQGTYASGAIWSAVCQSVRDAREKAGVDSADISAIAFDATCSLVVLDADGVGLSVASTGEPDHDTIAWFDHRARAEARECTNSGHEIVGYSGGVVSPEMEIPKIMWLKRHLPQTWARIGFLFDLADFLTWKATGSLKRSRSTLTAKWAFMAHQEPGWRHDYFQTLGIADMFERGQLPQSASAPGEPVGPLVADAARDLGLTPKCTVATGMIDAHAGALGVLGNFAGKPEHLHRHLGLVAGTSSCIMALSSDKRQAPGLWGPYYGAVLPGVWLNEGGQSAAGALLDHVIELHCAGGAPTRERHGRILARIGVLRRREGTNFASRLHVLPDFHGNRSPVAEPDALGVISGLDLDTSFDSLCRLYWRTAVGIALGLRHILETLQQHGYGIDTLHMTGGHTSNPLLLELYGDTTGCTIATHEQSDVVLLGSAMAAATAAGHFSDLATACGKMVGPFRQRPADPKAHARYAADYQVFVRMHLHRQELDQISASQPPG